jgi:hypothetical protein
MHVEDMYTTDVNGTPKDVFSATNREKIYYRVLIEDAGSNPVEGALVETTINRPGGGAWVNQSATTESDGWAYFEKSTTKPQTKGIYTIVVTNVSKSGRSYDPGANVKDSHQFELI